MAKHIAIPLLISTTRIAALPIFHIFFSQQNIIFCLILLGFCAFTDFLDGYLARRFQVTSRFGAYFDALADFILMFGIYTIFYSNGDYPIWLLLLLVTSFLLFLITSRFTKKIYDPVGRYLGSALYIGIILTLIFPTQASFNFVEYAFLVFFLISLASRIISLSRKQH